MDAKTPPVSAVKLGATHYLPALDGLRFFAFLLVFISHSSPAPEAMEVGLVKYGWVGVELFFAISAFLFFRLLSAEQESIGRIDIVKFYARRLLRLYPLMIAWPLACLAIYGPGNPDWLARLLGIASFTDNLIAWFRGYNFAVPYAPHLWTLSFEFQIYAITPLAFLLSKDIGRRNFVIALFVVWLICFVARYAFVLEGAHPPAIWATPFLRPESVLCGMLLALLSPAKAHAPIGCIMTVIGGALLFTGSVPQETSLRSLYLYPVCALLCSGILLVALNSQTARRALSLAPLRFLGKISFGLYVFHWFAKEQVRQFLPRLAGISPDSIEPADYLIKLGLGLALTFVLATVSYFAFERWFLLLKDRVSPIKSRMI